MAGVDRAVYAPIEFPGGVIGPVRGAQFALRPGEVKVGDGQNHVGIEDAGFRAGDLHSAETGSARHPDPAVQNDAGLHGPPIRRGIGPRGKNQGDICAQLRGRLPGELPKQAIGFVRKGGGFALEIKGSTGPGAESERGNVQIGGGDDSAIRDASLEVGDIETWSEPVASEQDLAGLEFWRNQPPESHRQVTA